MHLDGCIFDPPSLPPRVPLMNSERNSEWREGEGRKEEGLPLTDGRPLQGGRIDSPLSLSRPSFLERGQATDQQVGRRSRFSAPSRFMG